MPCRDYDDVWTVDNPEQKRKIDKLTRLLCFACQNLDVAGYEYLASGGKHELAEELGEWWNKHQEEDRKHAAEELRKRQEAELKARALNKLSPREKKALGLL